MHRRLPLVSLLALLTACGLWGDGAQRTAVAPGEPGAEATATALKQVLEQGIHQAVNTLGRPNGYLHNPRVRIPLPEHLHGLERGLRRYGLERYADAFVLSMNRAAEAAVPESKAILLEALREMSIDEAERIARGPDNAATRYFRKHSEATLQARLQPVIAEATARSGVTAAYKDLMRKAPVREHIDPAAPDLDAYVARQAIDGLYLMIAEEERRIRNSPRARATDLLRQIFR